VNLPAQRLHAVLKPPHSLANQSLQSQHCQENKRLGQQQLPETWTDNEGQRTNVAPVRAIVTSSFQHQFRSLYLFMTALKHVTLCVLMSVCPYIHQKQVLFQYFCSVTPSIAKLLTGLDLLTRLHLCTHSQQTFFCYPLEGIIATPKAVCRVSLEIFARNARFQC